MPTIYKALRVINSQGTHIDAGETIKPSHGFTEQTLKQWAKKGLVSVNGEVIEHSIATPDPSSEVVPGRSRGGRGKKAQDEESGEDAE